MTLSTPEKHIMFLKEPQGNCFYKVRDALFIVYTALKHHPKNYFKKKVIIYVRTSWSVENFPPCQSLSCLPILLKLVIRGSFL